MPHHLSLGQFRQGERLVREHFRRDEVFDRLLRHVDDDAHAASDEGRDALGQLRGGRPRQTTTEAEAHQPGPADHLGPLLQVPGRGHRVGDRLVPVEPTGSCHGLLEPIHRLADHRAAQAPVGLRDEDDVSQVGEIAGLMVARIARRLGPRFGLTPVETDTVTIGDSEVRVLDYMLALREVFDWDVEVKKHVIGKPVTGGGEFAVKKAPINRPKARGGKA